MNGTFQLAVMHGGKETIFDCELLPYTYTYKIRVDVAGQEILFERDDEGNFRAMIEYEKLETYKHIERSLLEDIADSLQTAFKD